MRRFSRLTAGCSVVACLTNQILLLLDLQIAASLRVVSDTQELKATPCPRLLSSR